MSDYQLIVIGAGPGGYTAALQAAKRGLHTADMQVLCRNQNALFLFSHVFHPF